MIPKDFQRNLCFPNSTYSPRTHNSSPFFSVLRSLSSHSYLISPFSSAEGYHRFFGKLLWVVSLVWVHFRQLQNISVSFSFRVVKILATRDYELWGSTQTDELPAESLHIKPFNHSPFTGLSTDERAPRCSTHTYTRTCVHTNLMHGCSCTRELNLGCRNTLLHTGVHGQAHACTHTIRSNTLHTQMRSLLNMHHVFEKKSNAKEKYLLG